MIVLEKFHSLSQREKGLLIVLAVVATGTLASFLYKPSSVQPTLSQVVIPSKTAASVKSAPSVPVRNELPADEIRNPFTVPLQYQVKKEVKQAPAPIQAGPAAVSAPIARPVLNGVISSTGGKKAIIDYAGSSDAVGSGDMVGPYTVNEISDNQVVISGPEGRLVLNLGR